MDVSGKIALVTGGASGIGKEIVELLLQKHAKGVSMIDVNENALKTVAEELEKKYGVGKVSTHKCDVSSVDEMSACFKQIHSRYGDLNIVFNCAGIFNEVNWQRMFQINVNGVIIGTQLAIEYMSEGGVIINISSRTALTLVPLVPMYATSKSAVLAFTQNVATFDPDVIKKKLRVNTVCPAMVDTPMSRSGTILAPDAEKVAADLRNNRPALRPQDVVQNFLKLVEEPHHGQIMYLKDNDEVEMIEDHYKARRLKDGFEELYAKTVQAALQ